ncbi:unnamed protein product [Blepharisma stoltei]|uniref:Tetratricopeptide repeat protein n=1 Tax=Blepharisma stoltei TaxID=1481888 RepID=A0AAU9JRS5_9CILI|nr:unnamed protein product [Blepharisma stoltei]
MNSFRAKSTKNFQGVSVSNKMPHIQDYTYMNEVSLINTDIYKDINKKSKELMIETVSKSKDHIISIIKDLKLMISKEATSSSTPPKKFTFLYKNLQMSIISLKSALQNLDKILKEILITNQVCISKMLDSIELGLIGSSERLEEIISNIKPLQLDIKNVDGVLNIKIKHLKRYTNANSLFTYKLSRKRYETMLLKDRTEETLSSYKTIGKRMYKLKKYDTSIEYLLKFIEYQNTEKYSKDTFEVLSLLGKSYYMSGEYAKAQEYFKIAEKTIEDICSLQSSRRKKIEEMMARVSKKLELINEQELSNFFN